MKINIKFNIGDVVYFVGDRRIDEKITEDPFMSNVELFGSIVKSKVQSITIDLFEISPSSIHQSIDYHLEEGTFCEKSLFHSRKEAEDYLILEQMKRLEILQKKINNFKKRK